MHNHKLCGYGWIKKGLSVFEKGLWSYWQSECEPYTSEFSVAHGGRSDINKHTNCAKHKASLSSVKTSSKILSYFKAAAGPNDKEFSKASKEAFFAFHVAIQDLSFKSADC